MALFGGMTGNNRQKAKSAPLSDSAAAERFLREGKPEQAFQIYQRLAQRASDATAQFNLATLYALGRGCTQDFLEAARWFRRSGQNGNAQGDTMVRKCELDYIRRYLKTDSPKGLYDRISLFVSRVYPEGPADVWIARELTTLGMHHFKQEDYASAAKLLRASAQFCDDGQAQNFLGVLYNAGAGVSKNDLAALYWLDRAVDNAYADARPDRDGILGGFRKTLSPEEFREYFELLARWCETGTGDVAPCPQKAGYWRAVSRTGGAG